MLLTGFRESRSAQHRSIVFHHFRQLRLQPAFVRMRHASHNMGGASHKLPPDARKHAGVSCNKQTATRSNCDGGEVRRRWNLIHKWNRRIWNELSL